MSIELQGKSVLLTGGRAPVALDLARKLSACGWTVYVAESVPTHLCTYSRAVKASFFLPAPRISPKEYIQGLSEIIFAKEIDLLIPTCEEVFYIARYKEQLISVRPGLSVFVDSFEKLKMLHNKWEFIEYARNLGKVVPRTWVLTSQDDMRCVKQQLPSHLILKPVYSRFASKIYEINNNNISLPQINVSENDPWVMQEYIDGKQYCSYSICHDGIIYGHTVYTANFKAGKGACVCFEHTGHAGILHWVQEIVEKLKFTGQIAFDFIETPEGDVYPLECNPRATSGIHLLSAQKLNHAIAFLPTSIEQQESKPKMLGLAMLLFGIGQCKCWSDFKNWIGVFRRSQDIVFSPADPMPFFHQLLIVKTFYAICRKNGTSILEATTHDIEWNGEML